MPKPKTAMSEVRSIVASLDAHLEKLRQLAPAGYELKEHDGNCAISTWRWAINTLAGARECVDDLAADLEFASEDEPAASDKCA
jgi:hypothetical protein